MPKQKALLDNYPNPDYADGKRLKNLREYLRIGQVELSKLAGISQVAISRIESDALPFSKRARNKIWPVIIKLLEQHSEELKSSVPNLAIGKKRLGLLSGMPTTIEEYRALRDSVPMTAEQRLQFEKSLLEGELQGYREAIASKDAQIATLVKALDAALQANADYAKLFALKGASVAADELQQEIESRQQKDKGEPD